MYSEFVDVTVILNSSLAEAARRTTWGTEILTSLDADGKLSVVPDRFAHLSHTRRLGSALRAIFGRRPLHTVLRAEPLAYLRAILGRPGVIELTGPGSAESRARKLPLFLLRRFQAIRLLTPSVASKFEATLAARLDTESVAEVMSRAHTATTPYFNLPRESINFAAKEPLIVSASRFERRKNVICVAQAIALALPQLPGWSARVAGQGEDAAEIQGELGSLINDGRVMVGYDADIEKTLRSSRIYVSLIEPDNYPSQAVLEAMHYGNALILSDRGDSDRFIGDSANGTLVSIDPQKVADQLISLANKAEHLEQMGRSSIERVHKDFDPRLHIAELLGLHGIEIG